MEAPAAVSVEVVMHGMRVLTATLAIFASVCGQGITIAVPADLPTIGQAVASALPGDTVLVSPGVYSEDFAITASISVVSAAGPDFTHIVSPGGPISGIVRIDCAALPGAVLRGFTIRDCPQTALDVQGVGTVVDCVIRDNFDVRGAVRVWADVGPVVFSRCRISGNVGRHGANAEPANGCLLSPTGFSGAMVYFGAHGAVLQSCAIVNNVGGDAGLRINCSGPAGDAGPGAFKGNTPLTLVGCTIAGNVGGQPSVQFGSQDGAGAFEIDLDAPTIINSIVRDNVGLTFDIRDRIPGIPPVIPPPLPFVIRNSNVQGYIPSALPFPPDTFLNNIDVPAQFVAPLTGDFHLSPSSPCIDMGDATMIASTTDFEGNPRIVGASTDMGFDEFVAPLQGTNEGLQLLTTVDGLGAGLDQKFAPATSELVATIDDEFGTLAGAVPVLLGQVFANGMPPVGIPSFPLHLDFPGLALFYDGNATPGPLIGAMPVSFGPVAMPPGLAGLTLRLQAFGLTPSAANSIYAATHARDLVFQ